MLLQITPTDAQLMTLQVNRPSYAISFDDIGWNIWYKTRYVCIFFRLDIVCLVLALGLLHMISANSRNRIVEQLIPNLSCKAPDRR
jgi:hypothetical protein